MLQPGDIFAEDVEFDVDDRSYANVAEVGMLEGVGDDGYLERVVGRVAYRQRYAVHRH